MPEPKRITEPHDNLNAAQGRTKADILAYLRRRPDQQVRYSDLRQDLGMEKKAVQAAMRAILADEQYKYRIDVILVGNAWRWNTIHPKSDKVPVARTRAQARAEEVQARASSSAAKADAEPGVTAPGEVKILQVLPDDSLVMSVGGKPYYAKPIV
jgi:hypothetical protein